MTELQQIKYFIKNNQWIFAKTYAGFAPHEYVVYNKLSPQMKELFRSFVVYIRKNGYKEHFKTREFTYFNIDGYKYWTMGESVSETIILNRAKI